MSIMENGVSYEHESTILEFDMSTCAAQVLQCTTVSTSLSVIYSNIHQLNIFPMHILELLKQIPDVLLGNISAEGTSTPTITADNTDRARTIQQ